jgi:hypothetical protein
MISVASRTGDDEETKRMISVASRPAGDEKHDISTPVRTGGDEEKDIGTSGDEENDTGCNFLFTNKQAGRRRRERYATRSTIPEASRPGGDEENDQHQLRRRERYR